jgi:hypothetical protein
MKMSSWMGSCDRDYASSSSSLIDSSLSGKRNVRRQVESRRCVYRRTTVVSSSCQGFQSFL